MRIFFQNPTKGPLITLSFDAGDDASLAFVPAVVDCGAKTSVLAVGGAAGAPVIATVVAIGAWVSGDSPVRVPVPVVPNPIEGINRFAPRASVDAIEDGRTIERTMQSADAVGLPDEGTPTTAADVSPLAGLAAKLKAWDGISPLEIAGFRFEKVADTDGKPTIKITISTDNVQDIIDTARVIQVAFPEGTHTLAVEVNAPNLRRNILKWAHRYFDSAFEKIKSQRDRILEISRKLETTETLSAADQQLLQDLAVTVRTFIDSRREAFDQESTLIHFLVYQTSPDSGVRQFWGGFMHDAIRRRHTLFNFDVITRRLSKGRPLTEEYLQILDAISSSSLEYIIKNAISLIKDEIKKVGAKIKIAEKSFDFSLASDEYIDVLVDIIANLISNAARYNDPQKETHEIHVSIKRTDDGLEIEVRDNGIGIPAEKLTEIGQFGFRVGEKSVNGSHGHGLWQVRQNLEDLGWEPLQVESTHGDGSRFRFVIPESDLQ